MCPKCGKENPTPERSMCPDCAARNSELRKQNRKYHERIGICTHCGKNPAEPNKKLCYECLGQFQDSYSEKGKTDEQKEKDRLRKRQLKQTRIENGLCPRCGKHQSQNGGLCQRCRAYLKNYRDKNRCDLSRSERPDYGICYICGKNPTIKGKKVCDKCYETRLSTLPAMWENANNDYFRQLNYARFCMIKNQRKEKTSGSDFNV